MIAALLAVAVLLQDPPPLPPPPDAPVPAPVVVDVDGEPVAPGKLPKSTSPEARAAWERLAAAVAVAGETRAPIRGFDLKLDLKLRVRDNQNNQFSSARYAYLAPGYLLADTGKGRKQVRGPKGDWLHDASQPPERAYVALDVGRENAEDRRQLDEALDVARLFVLLLDARNVRVVRFAAAANPEAFLPTKTAEDAKKLAWFELETPDVRPGPENKVGARILMGLAIDTGLPVVVLADDVRAPRRVQPTTSCVTLAEWKTFDGWRLPKQILVYLPRVGEATSGGARTADGWRTEPAMDLVLLSAALNAPTLTPAEFVRPEAAK